MTKQLESQLEAIKKQSKTLSADRDYAYDLCIELEEERDYLLMKSYRLELQLTEAENKFKDCCKRNHKLLMKIKELKSEIPEAK